MVDDITKWLEELGLGKYTDLFVEHEIDADILPDLTDADLKDLGIPLGSRKKLLKAIATLDLGTSVEHPADTSTPTGERRQVTVLFADLSGYTKLSNMIDAEEAHALLSQFFDRADGIVRDYGGTVDKHIGDSVMALFGAPLAHDNDPERAVRAADAIQRAMPDLAGQLGRPLDVHIGVASGQVVASGIGGDTHYTVIGDSVNLAARLTDAAGPGEILITAAVERAPRKGAVVLGCSRSMGPKPSLGAVGRRNRRGRDLPICPQAAATKDIEPRLLVGGVIFGIGWG